MMNITDIDEFSKAIKDARIAANLTQTELATKMNVGRDLIARMERGENIGIHHVLAASKACNGSMSLNIDQSNSFDIDEQQFGPHEFEELDLFSEKEALSYKKSMITLILFSINEIVDYSLNNLSFWKSRGSWEVTCDEWLKVMESRSESIIKEAMISNSDRSKKLLQSPPFEGMVSNANMEIFLTYDMEKLESVKFS